MHDNAETKHREAVILGPGEGRAYSMGRMCAVFKADNDETMGRYSVSEWSLDPNTKGPGAHAHPEDDMFFVTQGTMSVLVGDKWIDASAGSFVLVPGGTVHDFENRGKLKATVLNLSIPGPFEPHMPSIVEWFKNSPVGDANPDSPASPN